PSMTLAIATSAFIVLLAPGRPYLRAAQWSSPAQCREPPAKRESGPRGPSLGEARARPDSLRHRIYRERRPRLPELLLLVALARGIARLQRRLGHTVTFGDLLQLGVDLLQIRRVAPE